MKKTTTIVVAAAAAVLVIGSGVGIAAAATITADPTPAPIATEQSTPPASIAKNETPAPPNTPAASPWPYAVAENGVATYLAAVKAPASLNGISIPSDAELIADARSACDQLAAGVPFNSIEAIQDDPNPPMVDGKRVQITNSRSLAGLASETVCTEFDQRNVAP